MLDDFISNHNTELFDALINTQTDYSTLRTPLRRWTRQSNKRKAKVHTIAPITKNLTEKN